MSAKHTPGPWTAATSFRGVYSQHPAPGPVQICRVPENYDWPEQWSANARLIAAAPRMYDYVRRAADAGDTEALAILEAAHGRS